MRRRAFIAGLGAAAVPSTISSLTARAQRRPTPVVGFLGGQSFAGWAHLVAAFQQGLASAGFIDGQNVAIEYRWADGQYDQLPALAADLVLRGVAVVAANGGTAAVLAAMAATPDIPIVFVTAGDPVGLGFVPSINRPGGNVTGVTFLANSLAAKRMQLLRDLVPGAKSIGLLVNPDNPNAKAETEDVRMAAQIFGHEVHVANAASEQDMEDAYRRFVQLRVKALIVAADANFVSRRERLAALAARHALPAIYATRENVEAGGLMGYSASLADATRQAGIYAGRILKGERAADLPVQQSVKILLLINLKAARALALEMPATLLALADEVIE